MSGHLEGRCAIVTGGGFGLGRAVCRAFAREGATLVVAGLPGDPVDLAISEVKREGGAAVGFRGDCADHDEAQQCVDVAMQRFGRLDALILNGHELPGHHATQDVTIESFQQSMRDNVHSAFMLTQCALRHLQTTGGAVLATATDPRRSVRNEQPVYRGTQAFMHAFINGLAIEQAPRGVRANCICPAWSHHELGSDGSVTTVESDRATAEQLAQMYVFLAGEQGRAINGELLYADDKRFATARLDRAARAAPGAADPAPGEIEIVHAESPRPQQQRADQLPPMRRREPRPVTHRGEPTNLEFREVVHIRPMNAFTCITQQLAPESDQPADGEN